MGLTMFTHRSPAPVSWFIPTYNIWLFDLQLNIAGGAKLTTADSLLTVGAKRNPVSTTPNGLDLSRRRGSLPSNLVRVKSLQIKGRANS